MEFIEAPTFTAMVADYVEDDEYRALQLFLAGDPQTGDVMPGTGGFRMLRWADRRRGKGKRGGLRVIYYHLSADAQIWLMTLYDKDEMADLSSAEKRAFRWLSTPNSRGEPCGAGYEGHRLWQRRSDQWLEGSAASFAS